MAPLGGWIEESVRFVGVGPREGGRVAVGLTQADAHAPALGDGPAAEADVGGGLAHHRLRLVQAEGFLDAGAGEGST